MIFGHPMNTAFVDELDLTIRCWSLHIAGQLKHTYTFPAINPQPGQKTRIDLDSPGMSFNVHNVC